MTTTDTTSIRFRRLLQEIKSHVDVKHDYHGSTDPMFFLRMSTSLTVFPGNSLDDAIALGFARSGLNVRDPVHWKLLLALFCTAHFGEWPKIAAPKHWTRACLEQLGKHVTEITLRHPAFSNSAVARVLKNNNPYKEMYGSLSIEYLRELIASVKKAELEFEELAQSYLKSARLMHESVGVEWTNEVESRQMNAFIEMDRKVRGLSQSIQETTRSSK
jgi:hypothetical protein